MRLELQEKLFNDFPDLYCERHLPMDQTCMCWGFECPDEWYDILYHLSQSLTDLNKERSPDRQVRAVQVKEKFNGLRFYINGGNEEVYQLIRKAEEEVDELERKLRNDRD